MIGRLFTFLTAAFIALPVAGAVLALGTAGPAELPPPGFEGQQYVDSRGCVFLRAGVGGQVRWVLRMTADREPLCGYPPSVAQAAASGGEPAATSSRQTRAKASSNARRQVRRGQTRTTTPLRLDITPLCPAHAPHSKQARTADGRMRLYCSADPNFDLAAAVRRTNARLAAEQARFAGRAEMPVPKGYHRVWKDGRLNPHRGAGTSAGQAAQDLIWTRDVPAKLRPDPQIQPVRGVTPAMRGYIVQVGRFGVPGNVRITRDRLARMGIQTSVSRSGGMQTVQAGPFATLDEARQILAVARRAGFGDAVIRR